MDDHTAGPGIQTARAATHEAAAIHAAEVKVIRAVAVIHVAEAIAEAGATTEAAAEPYITKAAAIAAQAGTAGYAISDLQAAEVLFIIHEVDHAAAIAGSR